MVGSTFSRVYSLPWAETEGHPQEEAGFYLGMWHETTVLSSASLFIQVPVGEVTRERPPELATEPI